MVLRIESTHQQALFQWLSLYPLVYEMSWHTPNGGYRNKREGAAFKRQGVKSGVPDVFIAIPWGGYHGLFIELKAKGGRLTESQKLMHENLKSQGYKVEVCYSWFEARDEILRYLRGSEYAKLRAIS